MENGNYTDTKTQVCSTECEMDNYSLLNHNTFGIEAKAARFLEYASEAELLQLIAGHQITSPYLHIGAGSNLLFIGDYAGTILHSRIESMELISEDDKNVRIRIGAGMIWDVFVEKCISNHWYGAENLSLIPGEVGAAAVQNIGAYGAEIKDLITSVETIDINGNKRTYTVAECSYSYRNSIFKNPGMKSVFITHVNLCLSKQPCYRLDYGSLRSEVEKRGEINLENLRQAIIAIRESKLPDPKNIGNAGSFFMNPIVERTKYNLLSKQYPLLPHYEIDADHVKIPAGWLIEQCGWKGKSLGPAAVYNKQALVIINNGGATGKDIVALSDAIRTDVQQKFGIDIHPEVNFISTSTDSANQQN